MAVILSWLAGCSFNPPYERPALPTAGSFPDASPVEPAASPGIEGFGWRDYFADPVLRELIGKALDNNRDLRIAIRQVEAAHAVHGIRRADQFPTIGAEAHGSRARVPAELSSTGNKLIESEYQAALALGVWEVDFWGRVRSLKESALESFLATDEARRAVVVSLVAQVANTFLIERELDEQLAIAEQTVATREESHRIAKRRYEQGSTSRLDAVQTEVLLSQAQAALAALRRLRALNHNALVFLVGTGIAPDTRLLSQIEPGFAPVIPAGLPSDLLTQRPDILAAEHRLKSTNADVGAARAAFFPRITLTGAYGTASSELDGLFDSGSRMWSFMPSLSLPIFDAGRRRATLDLARARSHAAVADYERTIQAAFREVADALAERRWLTEQLAAQQTTVTAQIERVRLAQLRYDSGAAAYFEVLEAERDRFAAEQALVQTRRALLSSSVNLYAALGGGVVEN